MLKRGVGIVERGTRRKYLLGVERVPNDRAEKRLISQYTPVWSITVTDCDRRATDAYIIPEPYIRASAREALAALDGRIFDTANATTPIDVDVAHALGYRVDGVSGHITYGRIPEWRAFKITEISHFHRIRIVKRVNVVFTSDP